MSDTPSIDDVRAATIVEPKKAKGFTLKGSDTRGEKLFDSKKDAKASLEDDALAINVLQDALFAGKAGALLVVMQGIDTSGKDGATKEAFRYTSPLGVNVFAYGKPTEDEWAVLRAHPAHGAEMAEGLLPWLGEWAAVIVEHHERYDGTGSSCEAGTITAKR